MPYCPQGYFTPSCTNLLCLAVISFAEHCLPNCLRRYLTSSCTTQIFLIRTILAKLFAVIFYTINEGHICSCFAADEIELLKMIKYWCFTQYIDRLFPLGFSLPFDYNKASLRGYNTTKRGFNLIKYINVEKLASSGPLRGSF